MQNNRLTLLAIVLCLSIATSSLTYADQEYISGQAGEQESKAYTVVKNISTRYLAYRDLGPWFAKLKGHTALDYGSGLGTSTEFLAQQGFNVQGVDISQHMITEAKKSYPEVPFSLIKNNILPFKDKSFDLVFSCLVLFELDSKANIQAYAEQAKRVLKDDGYFIAISGSTNMRDPNFKSKLIKTDFPENKNATSGSQVRVHLHEINLTFVDYLWTEDDYREAFAKAGLPVCAVHYPLGKAGEDFDWVDELHKSPIIVILASKKCS